MTRDDQSAVIMTLSVFVLAVVTFWKMGVFDQKLNNLYQYLNLKDEVSYQDTEK